ncbi:hypothetical protein BEN47_05235 [Hymenobacter lapidarius]|uniref:Group 4 capsule polysaccharide lipoprotein gfcB, YjbF n=1 Tax=Hymenobacter lapidarius TaxID=1908237 RepID=A0A1G1STR5_9BACT|nr:hypothetical protein BEN47_05235 [Hymenobacter lapidarius]
MFAWRGAGCVATGLLLAACDEGPVVNFAQPFPAGAFDMAAFPARHQAVYTAADSSTSLHIGRTAVWLQELQSQVLGRHEPEAAILRLTTDSTYRSEGGQLHYLRPVGKDSIRDSWLSQDTIFALTGAHAGRLRRFQGRYYLSTPTENAESWEVQRLELARPKLVWQTLGRDTLRLRALDPATVHYRRRNGISYYQLTPMPGPATRHVGRYAGLWNTKGEFLRRR